MRILSVLYEHSKEKLRSKYNLSRKATRGMAWLIEKSGMKGAMVGGAQASPQHPNYIIKTSFATAADVRELAKRIKMAVHERFGVMLTEKAAIFS